MAKTSEAAVDVSGVSHRYGAAQALRDVALHVPKGAAVAVVGPDGVGKSTLLALIAGVKVLQQGRIKALGYDLDGRGTRDAFLQKVAFMPQGLGHNLYPTLSVAENIDFFGRLFGLGAQERARRMQRLLQATGLAPFLDRPAGKLSGGMKQKLSLCCALVHDPDLLILDEPTTGVDPLSRRQFWDLVDTIRADRQGLSVIVSTAYMEEAERFEHLVAMDAGRIIANGLTQEILAQSGATCLEDAYVAMLPEARRPPAAKLVVPTRTGGDGPPAIEADQLVRRFGDFTAVDHVSFRIAKGEIFGFLGSNGCGKTTTMKMLTGLLDASGGTARLFGKVVTPGDMTTRMRVGYMSQAFSLYEELSVRQNLLLHGRLYRVPANRAPALVAEALREFALVDFADALPSSLPLGIRQRLQLAAACLHDPELLILDEPTSGVDPAARDMFWRHLVRLSRERGVTIFVSTHFMNEAERCDRISLMHRGRVLAVGAPAELTRRLGSDRLEDAFITVLTQQGNDEQAAPPVQQDGHIRKLYASGGSTGHRGAWLSYMWAFARRETTELLRDPLRMAFALIGPIILLLIGSYSVSFDIQRIRTALLDHDQTSSSREIQRSFDGTRYFEIRPSPPDDAAAQAGLRDGSIELLIDIPAGFERQLLAGQKPEVAFVIDGSSPFTGESIRAYANAVYLGEVQAKLSHSWVPGASHLALPFQVEPRFIYNQEFRSIYAVAPGALMLTMILIPAMLTALGIVREKEIGSITNLYASPAGVASFLLGKQLPYVVLAMVSFMVQVALIVLVLDVPLRGSLTALMVGGALFEAAATSLGLMISCFVRSQVAAIFATALICLIPSVNFSGLLYPVSTLAGPTYWVGLGFPATWFQTISLGTFTKGLGIANFGRAYLALVCFALANFMTARLLLGKQER